MSLEDIAKVHNVPLSQIEEQVELGMKDESIHAGDILDHFNIVKDHLVESPTFYTSEENKKAFKVGGEVHHKDKESLVRDAKSGNTPARDLNNYNDVLDVQADGQVGGDTGIFKNGGDVKPYDANMEGQSIEFNEGGAISPIINNWDDVPSNLKNTSKVKKVIWSNNPYDKGLFSIVEPFLGEDRLKPIFSGINFDENGITCTDAH